MSTVAIGGVAHSNEEAEPDEDDAYEVEAIDGERSIGSEGVQT